MRYYYFHARRPRGPWWPRRFWSPWYWLLGVWEFELAARTVIVATWLIADLAAATRDPSGSLGGRLTGGLRHFGALFTKPAIR